MYEYIYYNYIYICIYIHANTHIIHLEDTIRGVTNITDLKVSIFMDFNRSQNREGIYLPA